MSQSYRLRPWRAAKQGMLGMGWMGGWRTRLANYGLRDKSSHCLFMCWFWRKNLFFFFLNFKCKVLKKKKTTTKIIHLLMNSCSKSLGHCLLVHKVQNIYYLVLFRKSLLTPVLGGHYRLVTTGLWVTPRKSKNWWEYSGAKVFASYFDDLLGSDWQFCYLTVNPSPSSLQTEPWFCSRTYSLWASREVFPLSLTYLSSWYIEHHDFPPIPQFQSNTTKFTKVLFLSILVTMCPREAGFPFS